MLTYSGSLTTKVSSATALSEAVKYGTDRHGTSNGLWFYDAVNC
jgi:hypothetical protein